MGSAGRTTAVVRVQKFQNLNLRQKRQPSEAVERVCYGAKRPRARSARSKKKCILRGLDTQKTHSMYHIDTQDTGHTKGMTGT